MRLQQRATMITAVLTWSVTAFAQDAAPRVVASSHNDQAAPLMARAAPVTSVRPAASAVPASRTPGRATAPPALSAAARATVLAAAAEELASGDADLVEHALLSLAELGGRDALKLLVARIRRGLPARLAEPAISALVAFGQPSTAPVLFELSQHRRWQVRQKAFEALGQLRAGGAQSSLLYGLDDPSAEVRSAAVDALGRVGDHRALPGLALALERNVAGAALALGRIGGPQEATLLLAQARAGSLGTVESGLHAMLLRTNLPLRTKLTIIHELALLPGVEGAECLAAWKANLKGADPRVVAAVTASVTTAGGSVAMATSEAQAAVPGDRP